MTPGTATSQMACAGVAPAAVAPTAALQQVAVKHQQWGDHPSPADGTNQSLQEPSADASCPTTALEDLQPDVLYHILLFLTQQDVAHVKMCSSRLMCNILRACQHWAPKVESWLAADPSSVGLLQQLRGAGRQLPPLQLQSQAHQAAATPPQGTAGFSPFGLPFVGEVPSSSSSIVQDPMVKQQQVRAPSSSSPAAVVTLSAEDEEVLQGSIRAARGPAVTEGEAAADTTCALSALARVPGAVRERLDWRQVWSCLERAQQGPWQLDARRLTPAAFPHGVLLTFELLLEQPAPPAEPGAREHQSGGWRDCVTVVTFTLDGKSVEIMVDASGRVTSPQKDWGQGSIKLQAGQPKLLALEVSYLFPVAAWFLHPCTLAAPKLLGTTSSSSMNSSSGSSSCASSLSTAPDPSWDSYSSTASSSASGGSTGGGMTLSHSAALCSAVSSLSFTSKSCSLRSSSSGRPRLCLDLSHGLGSYVSDPRFIDESSRNQRPRGLERLELAHRVCWRPSKVQSWLGRLLPGIRAHGGASSGSGSGNGHGGGTAGGSPMAASYSYHSSSGGGSGGGGFGGSHGGCIVGSPTGRHSSSRPSFAVTVSKAAVWQVPEDPEYRFTEGFAFWAVQHKAEQLLEHYGILPPWQGRTSMQPR